MRPKPDASLYYKHQSARERRELAEQKAKEAREALRDKLGLGDKNRIEQQKAIQK